MIIFLLLLILAVLIFGAGIFLKMGGIAVRLAILLIVAAAITATLQQTSGLIVIVALLTVCALITCGMLIISARADNDSNLLESEDGRALRAAGHSAQRTVEIIRAGEAQTALQATLTARATQEIVPPPAPAEMNHLARSAPKPATGPRRLIQDNLLLPTRIEYVDGKGESSTRKVEFHSAWGHEGVVDRLDGWCSKRRAERSFMLTSIITLTDLETGEVWEDAWDWFDARRYDDDTADFD